MDITTFHAAQFLAVLPVVLLLVKPTNVPGQKMQHSLPNPKLSSLHLAIKIKQSDL